MTFLLLYAHNARAQHALRERSSQAFIRSERTKIVRANEDCSISFSRTISFPLFLRKRLVRSPLQGAIVHSAFFSFSSIDKTIKIVLVQRDYISPQKRAKNESKGRLLRRSAF
ncbi:MAG: hypothetical protein VKK63_08480 [Synechococcus sp.]|nr:hypothetical protein [Synechococcus sp.]